MLCPNHHNWAFSSPDNLVGNATNEVLQDASLSMRCNNYQTDPIFHLLIQYNLSRNPLLNYRGDVNLC